MQNTIGMLELNLQLFNGAAAGGAGGTAGDGGAAGGNTQAVESALPKAETPEPGRVPTRRSGSSRRSRSGEYDNVVFGKQGDDSAAETANSPAAGGDMGTPESSPAVGNGSKSGVTATSDQLEAKRKAFQEMIDGEYQEQFAEVFQKAYNRRHSDHKVLEDTIKAQKPILDMLAQRYRIEDGDMAGLQKALEEDKAYWEQAAEQSGMTVEQYKAVQKLERENAELRALKQRQAGEQQAQEQLARWMRESESVKSLYPGFDLRAELANRDFQGLLKSGVPVQKAYELMHMDEIKEAAARSAAQATSQQMQARIKSKAARPSENASSNTSAVIVKSDVSALSRADRAEIVRRAQRGEKITF